MTPYLDTINGLLSLQLGPTIRGDELKGRCPSEEGDTDKFYLGADDCTRRGGRCVKSAPR